LWDINVNSNKSAVIHFRHLSGSLTTATFTLGELVIPIVRKYTYLGVILDEHLLFQEAIQARIEKASSAFYAMVAHLMKIGGTSHNVFRRLFDSLVVPVMDYGASVWSRFDSAPKET